MPTLLNVRDETLGGATTHRFELTFPSEKITVRELIRERVYQEVQDYNLRKSGAFRGLVQPQESEVVLNGYALRPGREVDWHTQFDRACEAFERRRVLVLVGGRQTTALDEMLEINPDTDVSFLKLVPLVGG